MSSSNARSLKYSPGRFILKVNSPLGVACYTPLLEGARGHAPAAKDEDVKELQELKKDDEDPDAGIEVGILEGSPIRGRICVLKKDADTFKHLLAHRYRNPCCTAMHV